MAKILLVEDDVELTAMIAEWLSFERHIVEVVHNGRDGTDRLRNCQYDVVILDWALPDLTGLEICRMFRADQGTTPIIMLTGRGSVGDKEMGLDSGADDYLTKPFNMKELSARIRALLRRSTQQPSNVLKAGELVVDPGKYKVLKSGQEITLLPREFALLEFFMRHPDEVFSAEALLQRVWHSESEATSDALRTCIKRLRQKIDADNENSIIQTIPRVGYRLKP
ncbi:MAG TPA: response regulator transcription factor [Planktothrix sp.]|jgi:DNA-binding response OmpR family regulator